MLLILTFIAGLYALFVVLDLLKPARLQPHSAHWKIRGFIAMLLYFSIAFSAPALWDSVLAQRTVFDASALPLWLQILGGFAILELGIYTWHRCLHASNLLWRFSHRYHHSAERIDIWGAFWFHPIDSTAWTFVGSLAMVGVFGVSVEAAIVINLVGVFLAMFQHANIATPRWLGYLIIRPENHSLHHARNEHRWNYCDLPFIDMLFGTFRNVEQAPSDAGFFDGASRQHLALLLGFKLKRNDNDTTRA